VAPNVASVACTAASAGRGVEERERGRVDTTDSVPHAARA
jgi:hypothetical protein